MDLSNKDYIVIVQCDIVLQRCPGYLCEKAFHERKGGFADLPAGKGIRRLSISCGGCCGRATHRKLSMLLRKIGEKEGVPRERILVHLASCITKDNYHGPACPHLDYLRALLGKLKLDWREGTVISKQAEARRENGTYRK